jgi:hypothetical protein
MFAVKAGHRHELIQYPATLTPIPLRISPCNRCYQLITRPLLIRLISPTDPNRSGANEIRRPASGTFRARRCVVGVRLSELRLPARTVGACWLALTLGERQLVSSGRQLG